MKRQVVHTELERLLKWLDKTNPHGLPVLIDGWMLAGKSHLANTVATATGGQMLDADDYLERHNEEFIEFLDVTELKSSISRAHRPVVASVCMRQIHKLIGEPTALHIYIKRMASWGWADEDDVIEETSDWSDELRGLVPPLVLEVREYHLRWKPHETADCIIERRECWADT